MADLFDAGDKTQNPAPVLEDLVGEGKKFADVNALAKAKVESDAFIETLKAETAEMRAELQARKTLEEMMEKIPSAQAPNSETSTTPRQEPASIAGLLVKETTDAPNLSEEVKKLLKAEKENDRVASNIEATRAGLVERFGADYNTKLASIASTLEVSEDFLREMGKKSPSGFLKLIDSVAEPDSKRSSAPVTGSVDTARVAAQAHTGAKNKAYYTNLRKTDRATYMSRAIQAEMHDEMIRQGNAFFN